MYGIPQNSFPAQSSASIFVVVVLKEYAPVDQQKGNFYFKLEVFLCFP